MNKEKRRKNIKKLGYILILVLIYLFFSKNDNITDIFEQSDSPKIEDQTNEKGSSNKTIQTNDSDLVVSVPNFTYTDIPKYNGEPFVVINNNKPLFTEKEIAYAKSKAYEYYGDLDHLGRAIYGQASIDETIRPKKGEKRERISNVRPTGFKSIKYDFIDNGGWLYNRSHLLGYQLTGENANPKNLITGTREFNAGSMLPFENLVADYLKENKNRKALYRVTAIYKDDDLVARGVLMEALSLNDDDYDDLEYCVFIYNVQQGIEINYKNGDNRQIK